MKTDTVSDAAVCPWCVVGCRQVLVAGAQGVENYAAILLQRAAG